jgi:hypothetical protein
VPLPAGLDSIAGAQELYDWFGYWPGFHDAEVLKLRLSIGEPSYLVVHTWEMTNKVNEQGFYELTKHIVVEFALEGPSNVNIGNLWERSILFDLGAEKTEQGFRLDFSAAYGMSGTISAVSCRCASRPGNQAPAFPRHHEVLTVIMVTEVTT